MEILIYVVLACLIVPGLIRLAGKLWRNEEVNVWTGESPLYLHEASGKWLTKEQLEKYSNMCFLDGEWISEAERKRRFDADMERVRRSGWGILTKDKQPPS